MPRAFSFKHHTAQFFDNKGGWNTKSSTMNMPLTDSPSLKNVDLSKTGAIRKRKGWANYTTSPVGDGGAVTGVFRLVKKSGASYLLAAEGTKLYEETATGLFTTERADSLLDGGIWQGVVYNDSLYLANGYNQVKIYKGGEAVTDLGLEGGASLPPAWTGTDQPSGLALTQVARADRMAAWGIPSDPSRVFFSAIQDPGDWTTSDNAFNILVLKDNGEPVTAVRPIYDLTIAFKQTQAAIYSGDSVDTIVLQQVYPVGCPAPRSLVQVGRDLYFWSQKGPARASGIQQYGDIAPLHIGLTIEDEIKDANWDLIHQVTVAHDKAGSRVIWFYPGPGSTENNRALVWEYDIEAWVPFTGMEAHSTLVYSDVAGSSRVFAGGYDGNINEIGLGIYSDGGEAYTARYITPWYDYGDYGRRKRILEVLFANGNGGYNVDIYYQWDFEASWHHLGNLSDLIPGGSATWGSATWGDFIWGRGPEGLVRVHPHGSGKVFRMKLENSTVDTTFEVLGWSMVVSPRGRR